jgi:TatD DNase family protein
VNAHLIDTHAHLNAAEFDADLEGAIGRARDAGVIAICDVGTDLRTSEKAVAVAAAFSCVYAAAGVHPHEASKASAAEFKAVAALLSEKKVVALGEIGLDYHYRFSPPDVQQAAFRTQVELGLSLGKPLIVHVREAMTDALRILRQIQSSGFRGVFHCYGGGRDEIPEICGLGFHISFTGVVTFRNFERADAVTAVPSDRLLLESDAPFMAPVPYRGGRNEPAFLRATADKIAGLRGVPAAEIARQTTENAKRLFGFGG